MSQRTNQHQNLVNSDHSKAIMYPYHCLFNCKLKLFFNHLIYFKFDHIGFELSVVIYNFVGWMLVLDLNIFVSISFIFPLAGDNPPVCHCLHPVPEAADLRL